MSDDILKDWRGNPIGVFTKVIGCVWDGTGRVWRVGKVTAVEMDPWHGARLTVDWSESSAESGPCAARKVKGVRPWDVTVFREGPN